MAFKPKKCSEIFADNICLFTQIKFLDNLQTKAKRVKQTSKVIIHPAFSCSKSTMEASEHCVKSVKS